MADPRNLSTRKKFLFAAVAFAAAALLAELGLALVGVRPVAATEDTSEGFSGLVSIYEREGDRYRTAGATVRKTFNDQTFLADKPQNGFRFFVLGGSSAYGYPWGAGVAFGAIVADVAAAAHPERTLEGVNAAGISYAMHRLNIVADEVLRYEPDALIIYSGHNEFVEPGFYDALRERSAALNRVEYALGHSRVYSALYRLRRSAAAGERSAADALDVTVRRESVPFTQAEKEKIVADFRAGLERLVTRARKAGVRVAILPVPANLRDWRPDRSDSGGLQPAQQERWTRARLDGERLLAANDWAGAMEELERARALAPLHAETHYLLAQAYEGAGRYDDARAAYSAACDLDLSPVRRVSGINGAARAVAREQQALLVDADALFTDHSDHGLVGYNLIEDYVHPNREGHELIAWQLWNAMEDAGWFGDREVDSAGRRDIFDATLAARTTDVAEHENVVWLVNQGVILRNQGQDELAMEKYRQALAIDPGYAGALWNLGALSADAGRLDEAASLLGRLLAVDPGHTEARVRCAEVLARLGRGAEALQQLQAASGADADAKLLNNQGAVYEVLGDAPRARALFERAVAADPDYAPARANLGKVLLAGGDNAGAREQFAAALRLQPDSAPANYNLGYLHVLAGEFNDAEGLFRRAVELDDSHARAHLNLGLVRMQLRDMAGARDALQRVLELEPANATAHNQLGMALASLGDLEGARPHFERAVELAPDDASAKANLQRLRQVTGR